jgi:hypothetical protein
MSLEWPTIIEGGIPILGGLYATAVGYGLVRVSRSLPTPPVQSTVDRFRWLGPAVTLFGIFTAWQIHLHASHPTAEELGRQIAVRLSFPVKIDAITQAIGVEGKGDDIIYRYSISEPLTELGGAEQVHRKLEQQLLSGCKKKEMQTLLRAGYTVQARYSFEGSPDEILVSVPPRSCGY